VDLTVDQVELPVDQVELTGGPVD